jgi:predicted homoserine dehydrogenase-like protein
VLVDLALQQLESNNRPIRVGMVGAGASARAIALQLATPVPGIRLVAISNRTLENGERAFREGGIESWVYADAPSQADAAINRGDVVLTDNPSVLTSSETIDVIIEVTGSVNAAAQVVLDAMDHGKHVVLVNAELDSTIGPILKVRADKAGVILTHTDGDEPGVAMTLIRYLRSVGLRPVAAGNLKGLVDYYRTPETQRAFAEAHGLDVRKVTSFADATKLSMEATVLANATGFKVGKRGMHGPSCKEVREMADLLPHREMLETGLVDYALGAAPYTGAFVIVHEEAPLKKTQFAYYKLGNGPFYVFYTPFHLPHVQIASTIGRLMVHRDATVAPIGGPVCEVVTVAKRDLAAGERLDGIGGFCAYGLVDNVTKRSDNVPLPIGLSEDAVLVRDVPKDAVVCFDDVSLPEPRLADTLWAEQAEKWSLPAPASLTRQHAEKRAV